MSEFKEEFKLKSNQENKKIIETAVSAALCDELGENIDSILLFGSFADNSFNPHSDIDICAVFKKGISAKDAALFRIRVSGELPEKVDVQVFNTLPSKIKKSIALNHKVLYKGGVHDTTEFLMKHSQDRGYFTRMEKIFGKAA